jgi:hypothetical protein
MLGERDGFRDIHNERVREVRMPSNGSRRTRQKLKRSLPKVRRQKVNNLGLFAGSATQKAQHIILCHILSYSSASARASSKSSSSDKVAGGGALPYINLCTMIAEEIFIRIRPRWHLHLPKSTESWKIAQILNCRGDPCTKK